MTVFKNSEVEKTFKSYPVTVRKKLIALRELIYKTAANTPGVGPLEEALKWGEPAYLTLKSKSGSTIRIAWKNSRPLEYAMYFNCQTNLIETFRTLFPDEFRYVGNRAIIFHQDDTVPLDSLAVCIDAALTYHLTNKN